MKTLILLAGYPGTGKTYMCNKITEKYDFFCSVSQDDIKEKIFDDYGYENLEERNKLTEYSREEYYKQLEKSMENGLDIISDYPFSEKQKGLIESLSEKYNYNVITIRLVADLDVLYERQKERDLDEKRHLSHIMSHYKKGDKLEDRTKADLLLTYDVFMDRCKNRGYGEFEVGDLLEVDVTNYETINYDDVIEFIANSIKKHKERSVLCIGQSAYDITYKVNEEIVENKKYRIYEKIECMGGPATNAAYLNALWGNKAYLMSRVGKDFFGKEIVEELEKVGVNTDYMKKDGDETSVSTIISNVENGNRTIFNCPLKNTCEEFGYPENVDTILVDGHEKEASMKAIELYPNANIIIDAGTYKEHLVDLIEKVDYLICSEDFAKQYTKIEKDYLDVEIAKVVFGKLRELNKNNIVVTLGEKGLMYEMEGKINYMPAFKVKAIDTTGAGDIFHGAFAYCVANRYSFEESLRISSMASAISVETMGGQISIPRIETVKSRLVKNN